MATTALTVGSTPVKLADAGADFFVSLPFTTRLTVELATTDTPGVAPTTTVWHPLRGDWGGMMNRATLQSSKEVWARCLEGSVDIPVDR
jgi:hypothetical protein